MAKVTIVLEDTEEGLVAVDTSVFGYDANSPATKLASRINEFVASIADKKPEAPTLALVSG